MIRVRVDRARNTRNVMVRDNNAKTCLFVFLQFHYTPVHPEEQRMLRLEGSKDLVFSS